MKSSGTAFNKPAGARSSARVQSLREISISYEGQDEQIVVRPPNLGKSGMFINTSRTFPEGAVLNVRFGLLLTGAEIQTRAEVRYCEPGVGVGVEFIGMLPEDRLMIEREIARSAGRASVSKSRKRSRKRNLRVHRRRRI